MFGAVMCDESNCKRLLEIVLEIPIFICDFDPFGQGKYRYTFKQMCQESSYTQLEDGSETIFLNTRGKKTGEVSEQLVKFLEYVRADLEESTEDFDDEFIGKLQKSVSDIKQSRRMEERYMLTELLMQDERKAGRVEECKGFILEFLSEIGNVSEEIRWKVMQENDLSKLRAWTKLAARVDSVEQFMEMM